MLSSGLAPHCFMCFTAINLDYCVHSRYTTAAHWGVISPFCYLEFYVSHCCSKTDSVLSHVSHCHSLKWLHRCRISGQLCGFMSFQNNYYISLGYVDIIPSVLSQVLLTLVVLHHLRYPTATNWGSSALPQVCHCLSLGLLHVFLEVLRPLS